MLLVLGRQQVTASNTQSLIVMHMKFLWRLSGMRQTPKTRYRLGWKRVMVSCQATNSIGQKVQSCSIIRWFKRRTEHYNSVFLVIAGLYAVMITFNVTKAKHIHTDRTWNAWARLFSYTIICTPTDRRRFILQRTANSWANVQTWLHNKRQRFWTYRLWLDCENVARTVRVISNSRKIPIIRTVSFVCGCECVCLFVCACAYVFILTSRRKNCFYPSDQMDRDLSRLQKMHTILNTVGIQ